MKYSDEIKHPLWQRKRLEILQRDDFTCQQCGDKETQLHVNHLAYRGRPWECPNEYLQTLCSHCHYVYHMMVDNRHPPPAKTLKVPLTGYFGCVKVFYINSLGIGAAVFSGDEMVGSPIGITYEELAAVIRNIPERNRTLLMPIKE